MAVSHQGVFVQTPKITPQSFVNADGTTKKVICTAGADGSKVVSIVLSSTDTANRVANLWLQRAAVNYLIGTAAIPLGSGTDGVIPSVNMLNTSIIPGLAVDNDGQHFLFLVSGDTLAVSMTVAVTAAKEIDVITTSGNF